MRGVICTVGGLLVGGAPAVAGGAEVDGVPALVGVPAVAGVPAVGGAPPADGVVFEAGGGGARATISAGVRRCMGTGSSASAGRHAVIAATARSPEIRRTVIQISPQ